MSQVDEKARLMPWSSSFYFHKYLFIARGTIGVLVHCSLVITFPVGLSTRDGSLRVERNFRIVVYDLAPLLVYNLVSMTRSASVILEDFPQILVSIRQ
jgi:hypothetical protein